MRVRAASAPLQIVVAVLIVAVLSVPVGMRADAASVHRPPPLGTIVLAEIGFGYTVTSQGPLAASQFPTGSPSASAAAGALSTLGNTIETYQRSWQDATGVNQVQALVVRFRTEAGARAFVSAARHAIAVALDPRSPTRDVLRVDQPGGGGTDHHPALGRLRRRALLLLGRLGQPGTDHARIRGAGCQGAVRGVGSPADPVTAAVLAGTSSAVQDELRARGTGWT
jgi:hypothetical protein